MGCGITSQYERPPRGGPDLGEQSAPQTPYAVDLMDDNSRLAYGAWPERLVVIEDGVVQYYGGQGPWDYKPKEVADWLSHRFNGAPIKVWPLSRL